ncbi:MAG: hypothetical protein ACYC5M_17290 [Anaerolineae bacterium]
MPEAPLAGLSATTPSPTPSPATTLVPEPTRARLRTCTPGPTHTATSTFTPTSSPSPTATPTLYRPWLTLQAMPTYTPSPTRTPRLLPGNAEPCERVLLPEDMFADFNPMWRERVTARLAAQRSVNPDATLAEFRRQGRQEACYVFYSRELRSETMFGVQEILSEVIEYKTRSGAARALRYHADLDRDQRYEDVANDDLVGFPKEVTALRQVYTVEVEGGSLEVARLVFYVQRGSRLALVEVTGLEWALHPSDALYYVEIAAERIRE